MLYARQFYEHLTWLIHLTSRLDEIKTNNSQVRDFRFDTCFSEGGLSGLINEGYVWALDPRTLK